MTKPKEIYILETIDDNPIYEGFGVENINEPSLLGREDLLEDLTPGYEVSETVRVWKPVKLANVWKPLRVEGRVAPFNDFPGVDSFPAFSQRACDILRDLLELNGELLPLDSSTGQYYVYNITTVVDVLDIERSDCEFWCDPPTTAVDIDHYEFIEDKLEGLSIFRIYDNPIEVFVTDEFVNRVYNSGLNGFSFSKVWPLPGVENWRLYNKDIKKDLRADNKARRNNTLVIIFTILANKISSKEKKIISNIEDELDSILQLNTINDPYYGRYEGSDVVDTEYRLFISCPDVDRLENKLMYWLKSIEWTKSITALKRYGEMYDTDAKEVLLKIK